MLGLDPLTAGTLLTLAASSSNFCQLPKPAEINVTSSTQDVKFDYSRSLADLQGQEADTINPYGFHGISETQGFMKGRIQMVPSVKLDYKHYPHHDVFCIWYDSVDISFEIDPTIVIASEVYNDRCMNEAVRDHEMKHVMADRKIVNKYSKEIGRKVYDGLKQRGFKVGPIKAEYAQKTAERMQKTVFQIVEHEYKKMEIERAEAQQAIDSLEEYQRVDALCPDFDETRAALRQPRR